MIKIFSLIIFELIMLSLFEYLTDRDITKKYNYIIYNWDANPIKSIQITGHDDYELAKINTKKNTYKFYNWKSRKFKIERLENFNYINLYGNENTKKCGRDSEGNYLYFPENIECPINDIFISNSIDFDNYDNYTIIILEQNKYLLYTNKNTEGKILIDLRVGTDHGIQLNLEEDNKLCEYYYKLNEYLFPGEEKCSSFYEISTSGFFKQIDDWKYNYFIGKNELNTPEDFIYLYSINYMGISQSIQKDFLKNYKRNMIVYNKLKVYKIVMCYIIFILFCPALMAINLTRYCFEKNKFDISNCRSKLIKNSICFLIVLGHIAILAFNLSINIKYVQAFMNKINKDFEEKKNKIYPNIITLTSSCIYLLIIICIILFNIQQYKEIIKQKNENKNNIIINNDCKSNNDLKSEKKETENNETQKKLKNILSNHNVKNELPGFNENYLKSENKELNHIDENIEINNYFRIISYKDINNSEYTNSQNNNNKLEVKNNEIRLNDDSQIKSIENIDKIKDNNNSNNNNKIKNNKHINDSKNSDDNERGICIICEKNLSKKL